MDNQFTVFKWIPQNVDFLKRFLRRLERMEGETWIEKKYGFFAGADPWPGQPAKDVHGREIEATVTEDSIYPSIVSFRFRGGTFNIYNKAAFDYGRCITHGSLKMRAGFRKC